MVYVTEQSLRNMINTTTDHQRLADIVGRACVALFLRQTSTERVENTAKEYNNRGFNKPDSRKGSLTAKYYMKHKTLQEWQVAEWARPDNDGKMRIVKYWRQLNEVAAEKAAMKAAA